MISLLCNMMSMLCNFWDTIRGGVKGLSATTYVILLCVFGILGLLALLSFLKKSFDKGKRPKWWTLILSLLLLGVVAFLAWARA